MVQQTLRYFLLEETDMSLVSKLLYSILIVGLFGIVGVGAFASAESLTREFYGTQKFATIEDAQAFQIQVIKEAVRVGGTVSKANLTIMSPPTLTYDVYLPVKGSSFIGIGLLRDDYSFPYGERGSTVSGGWAFGLGFGVLIAVCIGFFLAIVWKDEKSN